VNINELIESGVVPKIHTSEDEDGAILIEWVFSDVRIGLNIEKNKKESGWHVVSKQITASGPLENN
jgi:hypothetical protein